MGRSKRTVRSYDLFSGFQFFTPGVSGLLTLALFFAAGILIASVVTFAAGLLLGPEAAIDQSFIISYPLMFIPAMMYAGFKSRSESMWITGYALDSRHFGRTGGILLACLCVLATFAAGFMSDALSASLPQMPDMLAEAMKAMTGGNFFMNLLSVSIMAPFFEEWLCRGMVLRGLLNSKDKKGGRLVSPAAAIIISAIFFAAIHMNIWQALPAFIIGCLLGYVYYKTGSLLLTMLMHCTNNTIALVCSHIDSLQDSEYWIDVLGPARYWVVFAACALFMILFIREVSRIPMQRTESNCDIIDTESGWKA